MDFLNKAMAQASDLFRSMSVGSRITAGLLLVAIVVSLTFLFRVQVGGPNSYLMNGQHFSASQLPAMEAAFGEANLTDYQIDGAQIRVPRGQEAKYMAALAAKNALPQDPLDYLDRALNDNPLLSDRHQRQAKILLAKQQTLEAILNELPGIERARVIIDQEEKPGIVKSKDKTASVTVKAAGNAPLSDDQIVSIRRLVASSVAGLSYENVALTDVNTHQTHRGGADSPSSLVENRYRALRRLDEKEWEEKILRGPLALVPGATVSVTVELSNEYSKRERRVEHDPKKSTAIQTTEKSRTRTQEGAATAGVAGYVANQPAALPAAKGKGNREDEEETDRQEVNAVGTSETEVVTEGMTPTRVVASVQVPTSYFEMVWRERNPAEPGAQPKTPTAADLDKICTEEIAKIRKSVAVLLPAAPGVTDPNELVTVTEFQSITPAPLAEPQLTDQLIDWLVQSWSTLGLIFLGLASLVMLRSMVRAAPVEARVPMAAPAQAAAEEKPAEEEAAETPEAAKARRLKRFAADGMSLRDELSQLVAEDPDAAANILRTWIGNAS